MKSRESVSCKDEQIITGQIYSIKILKNQNQKRRTRKTLKNHMEKMSICVSVCMSKIIHAPIKVGFHKYVGLHMQLTPIVEP